MPRINDIKQEYLTQNTGRYIIENNLAQSDIEVNPMRYALLNGKDAANDPLMKTGEVYSKDSQAYYPYVNPTSPTASMPTISPAAKSRYGNSNVYQYDQKPYYGPSEPYRVIVNAPKDQVAVPIEFGDLTKTHADEKNLSRLQRELSTIDAPEKYSSLVNSGVYSADSKAYYDPTLPEKEAKKAELKTSIENMKEDLLHPNIPNFQFEKVKASPKIQNYVNSNKEETNEFIANSYYYPVKKDAKGYDLASQPVGNPSADTFQPTHVDVPEGRMKTLNELRDQGSLLGVDPVEQKTPHEIELPPNTVRGTPAANREKPNNNIITSVNSNSVEAEETKKVFAEAEVIGEVLGNKYVNENNEPAKKNSLIEADQVENKKIVEADDTKTPSNNAKTDRRNENLPTQHPTSGIMSNNNKPVTIESKTKVANSNLVSSKVGNSEIVQNKVGKKSGMISPKIVTDLKTEEKQNLSETSKVPVEIKENNKIIPATEKVESAKVNPVHAEKKVEQKNAIPDNKISKKVEQNNIKDKVSTKTENAEGKMENTDSKVNSDVNNKKKEDLPAKTVDLKNVEKKVESASNVETKKENKVVEAAEETQIIKKNGKNNENNIKISEQEKKAEKIVADTSSNMTPKSVPQKRSESKASSETETSLQSENVDNKKEEKKVESTVKATEVKKKEKNKTESNVKTVEIVKKEEKKAVSKVTASDIVKKEETKGQPTVNAIDIVKKEEKRADVLPDVDTKVQKRTETEVTTQAETRSESEVINEKQSNNISIKSTDKKNEFLNKISTDENINLKTKSAEHVEAKNVLNISTLKSKETVKVKEETQNKASESKNDKKVITESTTEVQPNFKLEKVKTEEKKVDVVNRAPEMKKKEKKSESLNKITAEVKKEEKKVELNTKVTENKNKELNTESLVKKEEKKSVIHPTKNLRKDTEESEESQRTESSPDLKVSSEKTNSSVPRKLHTQGLKVERVKIIPMRKLMNKALSPESEQANEQEDESDNSEDEKNRNEDKHSELEKNSDDDKSTEEDKHRDEDKNSNDDKEEVEDGNREEETEDDKK